MRETLKNILKIVLKNANAIKNIFVSTSLGELLLSKQKVKLDAF